RVLETGEFIKVGSSKVIKTDVRVVAATNVNFADAIRRNKFREDLYYRLNQVPIYMPPLRERSEDVHLLFRKFTTDFSDKYHIPPVDLTEDAVHLLQAYRWPGNVRQLKNVTEQISVIEQDRTIDAHNLRGYLPQEDVNMTPMVVNAEQQQQDFSEREILYKVLFDMKGDLNDLKELVLKMIKNDGHLDASESNSELIKKVFYDDPHPQETSGYLQLPQTAESSQQDHSYHPQHTDHEVVEETLSLAETEKELIRKALEKHQNKRKYAAEELGISERTLYRKIKEYNLK
ncbi:MAG: sigma 54-interacting transcriptional regulator, partial [Bacteroidota bacterium]